MSISTSLRHVDLVDASRFIQRSLHLRRVNRLWSLGLPAEIILQDFGPAELRKAMAEHGLRAEAVGSEEGVQISDLILLEQKMGEEI